MKLLLKQLHRAIANYSSDFKALFYSNIPIVDKSNLLKYTSIILRNSSGKAVRARKTEKTEADIMLRNRRRFSKFLFVYAAEEKQMFSLRYGVPAAGFVRKGVLHKTDRRLPARGCKRRNAKGERKMIHEILLKGYEAICQSSQPDQIPVSLCLGTAESYGIERLHLTVTEEWKGLTITAAFHSPDGRTIQVPADGEDQIDVPPEATAQGGNGSIVFFGSDGSVQRISNDLYYSVLPHTAVEEDPTAFVPPAWEKLLLAVPPGGQAGQVLTKASEGDRDTAWTTVPQSITMAELEEILSG